MLVKFRRNLQIRKNIDFGVIVFLTVNFDSRAVQKHVNLVDHEWSFQLGKFATYPWPPLPSSRPSWRSPFLFDLMMGSHGSVGKKRLSSSLGTIRFPPLVCLAGEAKTWAWRGRWVVSPQSCTQSDLRLLYAAVGDEREGINLFKPAFHGHR